MKFRTDIARVFSRTRFTVATLSIATLAACGGDESGSSNPRNSGPNRPPVFSSPTSLSVAENVTAPIYQASASDPDNDRLTYFVAGGADAGRFAVTSSGQLSFITSPDFDLPTDSDRDNIYQVEISASDGRTTTTVALKVTVTNSKEGIAVRRVADGFVDPVAIAPINSGVVLVAEKSGAIYKLNPQTGTRDLIIQVSNIGPDGIIGLAAGEKFVSNGEFFLMYTRYHSGFQSDYLIVQRYRYSPTITVEDNSGPAMMVSFPQSNGGGWLGYAADGSLLAATGDGGGPSSSAQNDASFLGKLVRITPNPDPFAGVAPQYFLFSTIAKGLHRPSGGGQIDGGVLIGDRGQDVAQELNFVANGATGQNYGSPYKEGTRVVQGTPPANLTDPALEYFRSGGLRTGQAIVGGGRGPSAVASLKDRYVFADENGLIFTVPIASFVSGTTLSSTAMERRNEDFAPNLGSIDRPVSVNAGVDGSLYILDADGEIFRVEAG